MSRRYLRVYKSLDVKEIKNHLLIYGDLSGNCAHCRAMDLKLDSLRCPSCQTDFKYIAFRNIRNHLLKLQKLDEAHPFLTVVDFDDYSRLLGALKAEEFLR